MSRAISKSKTASIEITSNIYICHEEGETESCGYVGFAELDNSISNKINVK